MEKKNSTSWKGTMKGKGREKRVLLRSRGAAHRSPYKEKRKTKEGTPAGICGDTRKSRSGERVRLATQQQKKGKRRYQPSRDGTTEELWGTGSNRGGVIAGALERKRDDDGKVSARPLRNKRKAPSSVPLGLKRSDGEGARAKAVEDVVPTGRIKNGYEEKWDIMKRIPSEKLAP